MGTRPVRRLSSRTQFASTRIFPGSGFSLPLSISSAISTIAAFTGALRPSRWASVTTVPLRSFTSLWRPPVGPEGRWSGRGQRAEALEQGLEQQVDEASNVRRPCRSGRRSARRDARRKTPTSSASCPGSAASMRASGFAAPSWMETPNGAVDERRRVADELHPFGRLHIVDD